MKRLTLTTKCLADLDGILDYISSDNPSAAVAFVEDLISTCEDFKGTLNSACRGPTWWLICAC